MRANEILGSNAARRIGSRMDQGAWKGEDELAGWQVAKPAAPQPGCDAEAEDPNELEVERRRFCSKSRRQDRNLDTARGGGSTRFRSREGGQRLSCPSVLAENYFYFLSRYPRAGTPALREWRA